MKLKFSSVTAILLAAVLLLTGVTPCLAADTEMPEVDVKAAVLMDAATGDLLFTVNPDEPLPMAGLAVIMTALLTAEAVEREEIDYSDLVIAPEDFRSDIPADATTQNIMPGEELSVENLLYCALIGGASEACNILAEYVAGSTGSFVRSMNKRAKELGCTNTSFLNCHGLSAVGQFSTAHDLGLMAAAFVQHTALMDIANTVSREIPATNMSGTRKLTSSNYILRTDYTRYYYSYACGIKSTYTDEAGYCLASSMRTDDSYMVSIVLGCQQIESEAGFMDITSFTETKKLFRWFSSSYSLRDVLSAIEPVAEIPVEMGEGTDTVIVCSDTALSLFLPNDLDINKHYTRNITIYSFLDDAMPLTAPVSQGQILGELTITSDNGSVYGPYHLIANTDVEISRIELMRQRILTTTQSKLFHMICWLLAALVVLYIAFVTVYRIRRRKLKRALRRREEQARKEAESRSNPLE